MTRWVSLSLILFSVGCERRDSALPPVAPVAPVAPAAPVAPVAPVEELSPGDPNAPPAAPVADWSGTWTTTWGPMELTQQGGSVTGQYGYDNNGVPVVGYISGTAVSGRHLEFAWDEPHKGGAGKGHGSWVMAPDGASFDGTWGQGESRTDGGPWAGKR